jgi:hypothetical protein
MADTGGLPRRPAETFKQIIGTAQFPDKAGFKHQDIALKGQIGIGYYAVYVRIVEQYKIVSLEQRDDIVIQQKNIITSAKQNFKNIMGMDPVGTIGFGNLVGGMAIYIEFLMLEGGF